MNTNNNIIDMGKAIETSTVIRLECPNIVDLSGNIINCNVCKLINIRTVEYFKWIG